VGKSSPKVEVDLYYMSIHYGVCSVADAIKRIIIKEKEAWTGYVTSQSTISINKPDLFGGKKKEGGAVGTVHWLPGLSDQILPDVLATRLGCPSGEDCVGFRGIASAFFVGGGGFGGGGGGSIGGILSSLFGGISGAAGFYWSANQPYLPGTWITVERAPKGLNPDIALIPQPGTDQFPFEQPTATIITDGTYSNAAGGIMAVGGQQEVEWWDLETRQRIAENLASDAFTGTVWNWALANDGTAYAVGQYISGVDVVSALYACPPGGPYAKTPTDSPWFVGPTRVFDLADGLSVLTGIDSLGGYDDMGVYVAGPEAVRDFCVDDNAVIWKLSQPLGSSADFTIETMDGGTSFVVTGLVTRGGPTDPRFCHVAAYHHFFVVSDGKFYTIDDETGLIKDSGTFSGPDTNVPENDPFKTTFWSAYSEISLEDGTVRRSVDPNDWVVESSGPQEFYDPVNHAIWTQPTTHQTIRFLDRGERDANPAHIIYEALTDTDWGMGSPSTLIDVGSFDAAAQTLFDEPLGISLLWTRQSTIQDFIQEILNHANAVLFVDPQTGLLTLKLIRGDYDPDDLPTIDPSSANLENFGRKLWGEIVNEINVTWTNPDNEQDETVTAQDLASIATQGGLVSDSRNYYGVRYSDLAMRLAMRELRSAGAPLATMQAEVDRSFYFLRPASVLKVDWPEYGLDGIVVRVTSIDYGKPGDPSIKLSLIEDVFGLDAGAYVTPPTSEWEDPSAEPSAMEHQAVFTLPYYFAVNGVTSIAGGEYPDVLAGILASTSNADAYNYELAGQITLADGSTEWDSLATNNILGRATLTADLDAEATSAGVAFTDVVGTTEPVQGGFAIIGDGTEEMTEIALVTATGSTYDLERGVLDTVPRAWPAGTEVWFIDESTLFEDPVTRSAAEEVTYRLLTRTSRGLLPLFAAPLLTHTLDDRPWLPSRPANVKAYGVAFSSADDPIDAIARPDPWVTVDWSNRNRTTEDSQVLSWTDATTAPEADQTTTITVIDGADGTTVLATHDALTGTTFDVPDASFGSAPVVILRTSSERIDADGTFESLQYFDHWVTVGFAGGAEGSAGVGVFSPVGALVAPGALSGSGAGAFSGTGVANSSGAFSGSGSGAMSAVGENGGAPDANTLFLARFQVSPPINEVDSATGTLVGGASCDTGNSQLVCDGTGDWATWAGGSTFDVTTDWTTEFHTNQAAAEVGGTSSRSASGNSRHSFFFDGAGRVKFFADAFSSATALLTSGVVLDGSEHHVAVVRDGGTWRLYIDGVQSATNAWAGAPTTSSDTFFVGTDSLLSSGRDINGRFGRVKISNICRYPSGTSFTPPSRTAT
jgi:hypothetical protein